MVRQADGRAARLRYNGDAVLHTAVAWQARSSHKSADRSDRVRRFCRGDGDSLRNVTKIMLVRHAMCDAVGRSLAGRAAGMQLNEEGRVQARRVAELIAGQVIAGQLIADERVVGRIAHVYASPLERAM